MLFDRAVRRAQVTRSPHPLHDLGRAPGRRAIRSSAGASVVQMKRAPGPQAIERAQEGLRRSSSCRHLRLPKATEQRTEPEDPTYDTEEKMSAESLPRDASRGHGRAPGSSREALRLPNFLVVGAEKCGTTSLYQYLKQHPDVYLPAKKELHYFTYADIGKVARGPGGSDTLAHACATKEEYESYYRGAGPHLAVGEVSPSYFYFSQVSERINSELDRPKIIIMLRNPIHKAHSQYMHLVRDNKEKLPFFDALMAEQERIDAGWGPLWRYTESCLYSARISTYLEVFGEGRVKIGLFEELSKDPQTFVRDLFKFLGVAPDRAIDTSRAYNRSGRPRSRLLADFLARPNPVTAVARRWVPEEVRDRVKHAVLNLNTGRKDAIDDRSRAYLRERFANDVRELKQILQRRLNWLD